MMGVVLAGGVSSRFGGRPKGLLPFAGRAMALRAADVLLRICARIAIEALPDAGYEALGLPLLHAPPEHKGKGPLAGLAAGLGAAKAGRVAFAPCDMPFLDDEVYRALIDEAAGRSGVYATTADGFEPLVSVLDVSVLPALSKALLADDLPRTHAVLDAAGARSVSFADPGVFANVNTPADLERLEAQWRQKL